MCVCDLHPDSPPLQEDIKLDQIDKDVSVHAFMISNTVSQDGDHYFCKDDFAFFDTWVEHEQL